MPQIAAHTSPAQSFRTLAEALAKHTGRKVSTVVRWSSGSGDVLRRLEAGKTITFQRWSDILVWFDANWPADLDWPTDIPRPSAQKEAS